MDTNETRQELMDMMELIDTIKDKIGDGNYLQLCNSLKKVSDKQLQSNDTYDIDEDGPVWGYDLEINAKYECEVEFLEPKLVLDHNDSRAKHHIRLVHHGCDGIILTGAEVSNIVWDLQNIAHHNTMDDRYTGLSVRLHIELELYLFSINEPIDVTESKIFKSYTILNILYRKIRSSTENEVRLERLSEE